MYILTVQTPDTFTGTAFTHEYVIYEFLFPILLVISASRASVCVYVNSFSFQHA